MLEGDLTDFTLPDILQLLAFTSKSGRLRLHGEQAVGRIDFDAGQLRDASPDAARLRLARRLLGAGLVGVEPLRALLRERTVLPTDLELANALVEAGAVDPEAVPGLLREQAVDAVFDLLRWDTGSFRFDVHATPEVHDSLASAAWPTEEILAEAQHRLEEWARVREHTGAGDAVVTIARPSSGQETAVTPDGWSMLVLVDGRRTVDDLANLSGQGEFRTRSVLASLVEAGVVSVRPADEAPTDLLAEHEALAEVEAALELPTYEPPAAEGATTGAAAAQASEPEPAAEPAADAADAAAPADGAGEASEAGGEVTPLRKDARRQDRLRTDPTVDAELIERLIDGVESL